MLIEHGSFVPALHWFTAELFSVAATESENDHEVKILCEMQYLIPKTCIDSMVEALQSMTKISTGPEYNIGQSMVTTMGISSVSDIVATEQYKSVILTHHFHNFLNGLSQYPNPIMVLHQPPSCLGKGGHVHRPDIYADGISDDHHFIIIPKPILIH